MDCVRTRIEWDCMNGRAILYTDARIYPIMPAPLLINESHYVRACRDAKERKEAKALAEAAANSCSDRSAGGAKMEAKRQLQQKGMPEPGTEGLQELKEELVSCPHAGLMYNPELTDLLRYTAAARGHSAGSVGQF
eukprot:6187166-Pleurochrysis_carterae.AAC.2